MSGHDIFVIGTSAGGLKALTRIVSRLPANLDAALFIVQHVPADYPSLLPQILSDTGSLKTELASDGSAVSGGTVYVAPADHHMLLEPGVVRVVRGPRENNFRPSIDALFRSAARAYRERVVGVVLSGLLDDGTVGLQAIKKHGGITVVQDPKEAEFPGMPDSALRYVEVDYLLNLEQIADLLARAPALPAMPPRNGPRPRKRVGTAADENVELRMDQLDRTGTRTQFTCPTCHGTLWQIGDQEPWRFVCHVGHAFVDTVLLSEQTQSLENALWSALRLMEEKIALIRRMADRRREMHLLESADRFARHAESLEREAQSIRRLVETGLAARQPAQAGDG